MDAVRFGVIGVGTQGRAHLAAISAIAGAEAVSICDPDGGRLEQVAAEFRVSHATTDPHELVGADLDAVIVATPEHLHLEPTLQALEAQRHVLLEKPLATTIADARLIADAASRSGRHLMPGFNLRYEPRHRAVKDWLDEGRHGTVVSLTLRRNRPAPLFELYKRTHPAFETGTHDVDLVLWYTGRRAERVFAVHRQRAGDPNPFGIWALVELEGGAVAVIESVWLTPGGARTLRTDALEVVAEKGTAFVDVGRPDPVFLQDDGVVAWDPILDPTSLSPVSFAVRLELEDFLRCIRGEREAPETSVADAVHGVEIVSAIVRSAETRQPVELDSLCASR